MTWQTFAFLIIAGFAFSYSGWKFKTLIDLMRKHQGKVAKIDRFPERIITTVKSATTSSSASTSSQSDGAVAKLDHQKKMPIIPSRSRPIGAA